MPDDAPAPRMTELQKGLAMKEAFIDYKKSHTNSGTLSDEGAWIAVYRKALSLARL